MMTTRDILKTTVPYGSQVGRMPKTSRLGYEFDGWWTEPVGGEEVDIERYVYEDVTFYAHWKLLNVDVTITLDDQIANVDFVVDESEPLYESKELCKIEFHSNYEDGPKLIEPIMKSPYVANVEFPQWTREGYEFDGWYTLPEDGDPVDENLTTDKLVEGKTYTFYAHWKQTGENS